MTITGSSACTTASPRSRYHATCVHRIAAYRTAPQPQPAHTVMSTVQGRGALSPGGCAKKDLLGLCCAGCGCGARTAFDVHPADGTGAGPLDRPTLPPLMGAVASAPSTPPSPPQPPPPTPTTSLARVSDLGRVLRTFLEPHVHSVVPSGACTRQPMACSSTSVGGYGTMPPSFSTRAAVEGWVRGGEGRGGGGLPRPGPARRRHAPMQGVCRGWPAFERHRHRHRPRAFASSGHTRT